MSSTSSSSSLPPSSSHGRSHSQSSSTRKSPPSHHERTSSGSQSTGSASSSDSGQATPLPPSSASDADPSDPPPLSQAQILCLCLPAAAVQVGWTVGESLLIPYLLSLGVSNTVANFAWLVNPVFGLFLQPMLGHASDNCNSSMGRRRPFLALFHLGSVCGLLTVVFAADLLHLLGYPAHSAGDASTVLVVLIFVGFATADMCHDLMLMPARALLNDQLPDEQTDEGNSSFALISSLGAVIGLSMVIAPLDDIWPLSLLAIPIRATFVAAAAVVMISNIVSFFTARNIDTPLSELKERERQSKEEGGAAVGGKVDGHADKAADAAPSPPPHSSKGGEGELLTLSSILFVYRVVPRPLVFIWLCQFFFWYCVLHVNIWTSSYVAISLYGAEKGDEFDHGVRLGTIGLLIQAVVAFIASSLMTRANAAFGITNYYHASALLYAAAVSVLFLWPSYPAFLVVMTLTGAALPAIYSSPFVLIEVHAADNDDSDDDDEEDTDTEGDHELEERERRKEHRQLDIGSPRHAPHSQASTPDLQHAAAASPSSAQAASRSSESTPPRVKKNVSISLPSSHHASPEPSPTNATWSTPAKETDALLSTRPRLTSPSTSVDSKPDDGDEHDADGEERPVYDMAFLDEWRGVLTGVYNVTMILAQIIVGLTSGVMIDWWGDIRIVFLWSAALCFVVHSAVVLFGLSKPVEEAEEEEDEEEDEEEEAEESSGRLLQKGAEEGRATTAIPRRPPGLTRLSTLPPEMPPLIDYRSFSTRALPGRLRSYVPKTPARPRHLRHLTQHLPISRVPVSLATVAELEGPPALQRSRSAPALVLLSRPKGVVKGVPVFQAAVAAGRSVSNDRMKLERLRERTRLFQHLPSPGIRKRHDRLKAASRQVGGRPAHHVAYAALLEEEQKADELDHERALWYSGADSHAQVALRHDEALASMEEQGVVGIVQHQAFEADGEDSGRVLAVPHSTSAAETLARFSNFNDDDPQRPAAFTFDTAASDALDSPSTADSSPLSLSGPQSAGGAGHPFRGSFSLSNLYEVRDAGGRRRMEETVMEVDEEGSEDEEQPPPHQSARQSSNHRRSQ